MKFPLIKTNDMKEYTTIKKSERLTQVKINNKIVFEILTSKCGKKFHSLYKSGLGIVSNCTSFNECIEMTFDRLEMINDDFKKRLIQI